MRKKPRTPCPNCGEEPHRSGLKYCSRRCQMEKQKKLGIHYGGATRKWPDIRCKYCGKLFTRTHSWNEFCSSRCAGLHRRDSGQLDAFISMARSNTGPRNLSHHTRLKMSRAAARRSATTTFTKGVGGYREDLEHYVRSRWEANVCRLLKHAGLCYIYEPRFFELDTASGPITYIPDLKINSVFIEIKGWWRTADKMKRELMANQHPRAVIYYVGPEEYLEIEREFASSIPGWEFHTRRRSAKGGVQEGGVRSSPPSLR